MYSGEWRYGEHDLYRAPARSYGTVVRLFYALRDNVFLFLLDWEETVMKEANFIEEIVRFVKFPRHKKKRLARPILTYW